MSNLGQQSPATKPQMKFDSEYREITERTFIEFPKPYDFAPAVWIWIERVKGKAKFPIIQVPPYMYIDGEVVAPTNMRGFWISHTKFNPKNFKIFYEVFKQPLDSRGIKIDKFEAKIPLDK